MNHVTDGDFVSPPFRHFLARLLKHSELTSKEQEAILRLSGQVAHLAAGSDIVGPNTTIAHAHLVAQGIVARFDETKDGRRTVTSLFVPGDMCGLQSIECPMTSWGLSAFTACNVIYVPHDQLRTLIDLHPAIRRGLWTEMAIDASIQAKWTGNAFLKNSVARTAHIICELAVRMNSAGNANRTKFALKISQSSLAQSVGLTVIHMNRVLRELREKELVSTDSRMLVIKDWQGLSKLAEFDAAYLGLAGHFSS